MEELLMVFSYALSFALCYKEWKKKKKKKKKKRIHIIFSRQQSRATSVDDHFLYSHDLNAWFRGWYYEEKLDASHF